MFDPKQITEEVINAISWHMQALHTRLFWASTPECEPAYSLQLHQAKTSSPLAEEIALLCRVANGEVDRETASEATIGEIADTAQGIVEITAGPPLLNQYTISSDYFKTPIGQVVAHVQAWMRGDDLITYTDAARLLWPGEAQYGTGTLVARVRRMVERGDLIHYVDPTEPHPNRSGRVSRAEVEAWFDAHKDEA